MKNEKQVVPKGLGVDQGPVYYAKAKGWEHLSPNEQFWNYSAKKDTYTLSNRIHSSLFYTQLTKPEWNEIGINDSNADFEEV